MKAFFFNCYLLPICTSNPIFTLIDSNLCLSYDVASIPEPQRAAWKKFQAHAFTNKDEFEKEVVRHVETTLARSMFNCDETAAYAAASLAFRDRLITEWNRTQQRQTFSDTKRVYYLSLEFLMGRALDNAMLNVGLKNIAKGTTHFSYPCLDLTTLSDCFCRGSVGAWVSH